MQNKTNIQNPIATTTTSKINLLHLQKQIQKKNSTEKMGYTTQDSETGEVDYHHCDSTTIEPQTFDEETGEPLNGKFKVRFVKHKSFQIPKKYLRGTVCEEIEKQMINDEWQPNEYEPITVSSAEKKRKTQHYDRDDYMKMEGVQNDIILGYNKPNFRVFLVPTLFCFNVYIGFLVAVLESLLHYWAHMKNGLNMNKKVYYRSPLHVLTSQFCAHCRSESEMELKVFAMLNQQMRKARESKTLKDVSKAIS